MGPTVRNFINTAKPMQQHRLSEPELLSNNGAKLWE